MIIKMHSILVLLFSYVLVVTFSDTIDIFRNNDDNNLKLLSINIELDDDSSNDLYLFTFKLYKDEDPIDKVIYFCKLYSIYKNDCITLLHNIKLQLLSYGYLINKISLQSYQYSIINIDLFYYDWGYQVIPIDMKLINNHNITYLFINKRKDNILNTILNHCKIIQLSINDCNLFKWKILMSYEKDIYKLFTLADYLNIISFLINPDSIDIPIHVYSNGALLDNVILKYQTNGNYDYELSVSGICNNFKLNSIDCLRICQSIKSTLIENFGMNNLHTKVLDDYIYVLQILSNSIISNKIKKVQNKSISQINNAIDNNTNNNINNINNNIELSFIDLDFIEIGTSNFNTILGLIYPEDLISGISIEPILSYLNDLPDNIPGVIKLNAAITNGSYPYLWLHEILMNNKTISHEMDEVDLNNNPYSSIDIYYIPEDIIIKYNLPIYLKGCNSLYTYHPSHVDYLEYVVIQKAPLISLEQLFYKYRIRHINLLKIDAEGHDLIILKALFDYILKIKQYMIQYYQYNTLNNIVLNETNRHIVYQYEYNYFLPNYILFESNSLSNNMDINDIINRYVELGYICKSKGKMNTILEKIIK